MSYSYNPKINNNGEYLPFHGYTTVSMVVNDLNIIEEFLKISPLSEYFSPLPSETYHMTVYNIWCHTGKLLNLQKNWLDYHFNRIKNKDGETKANIFKNNFIDKLKSQESLSWVWPNELMYNPMHTVSNICKQNITESFIVNVEIGVSKTLHLTVAIDSKNVKNKLQSIKNSCTEIFNKDDSAMRYHITLAYQFKEIPESSYATLNREIDKLRIILNEYYSYKLILNPPDAYWFKSMTKYLNASDMYF